MRAKLAALLFLPLTAVLVLATVRLGEVGERAGDATRVADLAGLGTELSGLTGLLHDERMAGLAYLADPGAAETGYREAVKAVDARADVVRTRRASIEEIPGPVTDRLTLVDDALRELPAVRAAVSGRSTGVPEAAQGYGDALAVLTGYETAVSRIAEPGSVADGLRGLAAFGRVQASVAEQAAVTFVARTAGGLTDERQRAIVAAQATRDAALTDLRSVATGRQVALVDAVVQDDALARADGLSAQPDATQPNDLVQGFGTVTGLLRAADTQLGEQVVADAQDGSTDSTRRATIEFVLVLLVLIGAVAVAVYLGRSMHLAVRRLREGALAVANRDLPEAVTRLQDADNLGEGGVDRIVAQTRDPIRVDDNDEFGQVAEAFNMVHREAIRVAAEQAALRTSVSTMFLSLARRSQALVDRMIGELDQIERTEEDPKRLARLFELDHLATRMRRNDENLLVLAGAEVGAPRREDALLIDALRAAQSEVELYHRIEFGSIDTDVLVSAAAVNDVVRLIAELLDNATRFSPPSTLVMAHGSRTGDHAVVQVEDRGLGISDDQMEQINRRLTEPSEVDVSAFRLMGFAVIGRLAARHGISVELRPGSEGGTIAEVTLPAGVAVLPGAPVAVPSRAASWTRPGPLPALAEPRPPVRSVPMPPEPMIRRPITLEGPVTDLDLQPTPDRPPLPTRAVKAEPEPTRAVPAEPGPAAGDPIRLEMQHDWFDQADSAPVPHGMPTAGYAPPPAPVSAPPGPPLPAPVIAAPPATQEAPTAAQEAPSVTRKAPPAPVSAVPRPREAAEDRWRTKADDGWLRAMAATAPQDAGTTRSGLPKRIPQAQLVPGGVQSPPRTQHRRNPDEVRGLLSSYHRGVQRGRTDGVAESAATATHAPKENEQ
ncbi:nitrate- and nitrite sensing domain-containing protein [Actinoplanes sp. DH11]|uniref:sensor histidine kinase n=1 Tax=Actinoplanes sp. DH11 TaxID=2857011 RepID=UPI001E4B910D|nr:nitrate- and nitrite sensing domain-containing protein [Actinoplanes sp. DH11]